MTMTEISNIQLYVSLGTFVAIAYGFWKIVRALRGYKDDLQTVKKELCKQEKDGEYLSERITENKKKIGNLEVNSAEIKTDLAWIKTTLISIDKKI